MIVAEDDGAPVMALLPFRSGQAVTEGVVALGGELS
jgi:hypothetical protein